MASFNKVILMGNLTRDPELKSTSGGSQVCEMSIAMNRKYTANGQEREECCFVDVVAWGKTAENCKRYLEKGSSLMVDGRLQQQTWQDKQTGANRSKLVVLAETVQFIGGGQRRDNGGHRQPPQSYDPYAAPPEPTRQPRPPMPPENFDPPPTAEENIPF